MAGSTIPISPGKILEAIEGADKGNQEPTQEEFLREHGWAKVYLENGEFLGWCFPKKPPFMVMTEEYALNWLRNQPKDR
jgi:hypothetical protein